MTPDPGPFRYFTLDSNARSLHRIKRMRLMQVHVYRAFQPSRSLPPECVGDLFW